MWENTRPNDGVKMTKRWHPVQSMVLATGSTAFAHDHGIVSFCGFKKPSIHQTCEAGFLYPGRRSCAAAPVMARKQEANPLFKCMFTPPVCVCCFRMTWRCTSPILVLPHSLANCSHHLQRCGGLYFYMTLVKIDHCSLMILDSVYLLAWTCMPDDREWG